MKVYELIQILTQHQADAKIRIIVDGDYQDASVKVDTIPLNGRDVTIEIEK